MLCMHALSEIQILCFLTSLYKGPVCSFYLCLSSHGFWWQLSIIYRSFHTKIRSVCSPKSKFQIAIASPRFRCQNLIKLCLPVYKDVRVPPDGWGEVSVEWNGQSVVSVLWFAVVPARAEVLGVLHRHWAKVDQQLERRGVTVLFGFDSGRCQWHLGTAKITSSVK